MGSMAEKEAIRRGRFAGGRLLSFYGYQSRLWARSSRKPAESTS